MDVRKEEICLSENEELIGIVEKNSIEIIVAKTSNYRGSKVIDFRVFYRSDDMKWKPGKKGLAISSDSFDEFKGLVLKVEETLKNEKDNPLIGQERREVIDV